MTSNVILEEGKTDEVTIQTTRFEEIQANRFTVIVPPSNTTTEPTRIANFLIIEKRFNINGQIAPGDRTALKNIMNSRTPFTMKYAGTIYTVGMEKFQLTEVPEDAGQDKDPEYLTLMISLIEGVDYTSA